MFCEQCGQKLPDGSKFCGGCGAKQTDASVKESVPKPMAQPAMTPPPISSSQQSVGPAPQPQYVQPQQPQYQAPPVQPSQPTYQAQPVSPQIPTMQGSGIPPLSVGEFLKMQLLLCIPVVNFILLLIWSFDSSNNKNKRNYALASLLFMVIMTGIGFLLFTVAGGLILTMISNMNYY